MSLDVLKKGRRPLRAQLNKKSKEIEVELSRDIPDKTAVQVKLEMLKINFKKVDDMDQQVITSLTLQGSDEDLDSEMMSISEYEERFMTAKLKAEKFLVDKVDHVSDNSTHSGEKVHTKTYKLPKIEIRKFDGDLKEWLGFWSQFQKIHNDNALHDSDKFQYLVQSMIPGTRAYKLVNSYPQTAENYELVIKALKDRFGDKVLLTEVYVRQLLKLVIRNAGKAKVVPLGSMYDELESHLRALETLGVTQEQSAAFLYPLVESSLPEEVVRVWQRSALSGYDEDQQEKPVDERLKSLMKFLRMEVKGAERLSYVNEGFSELSKVKWEKEKRETVKQYSPPTAAGLFVGQRSGCVFCDKPHDSQTCVTAQTMSYGLKKRKILEKKACLSCLKGGHLAKSCKSYLKCIVCQKKHVTLMCPDLEANKKPTEVKRPNNPELEQVTVVHSQLNCTNEVLLQTLKCVIRNKDRQKTVRVLLDPGSQKSYILERTAQQLGIKSKGEVKLCHLLFGGYKEVQRHSLYEIEIEGSFNKHCAQVKVLSQQKICGGIPRMSKGPWMAELKKNRIFVDDLGSDQEEIELLIGSDYYAQWLTGRRHCLENGLVALETCFGWTLSGKLVKVQSEDDSDAAMLVTSMLVTEASVAELWNLEAIGIRDPVECKTKREKEIETKEHFLQTVTRSQEGRYSVSLPWIEGRPDIPHNREIAEKRLRSLTKRLQAQGKYQEYQQVFEDWMMEGLIEMVEPTDNTGQCHYLPHRAVFKPESQTTPVRPVFDASCKSGRAPSLNDVLEKGPNLLELLPTILLRFRENKIGVVADIRKAFQMIEVAEKDRDFLRFLWWEDIMTEKIRVYRHRRVVFGVNCSPFLLAAVLELHLKSISGENKELALKLLNSLYVDNCATSVSTHVEYEHFRNQTVSIMLSAGMNLRNWDCSLPTPDIKGSSRVIESEQSDDVTAGMKENKPKVVKMLGLLWDKVQDTLSCDVSIDEVKEGYDQEIGSSLHKQDF